MSPELARPFINATKHVLLNAAALPADAAAPEALAWSGEMLGPVNSQLAQLPDFSAAPELLKAYPEQLVREPIAMGVRKGDADTLNFLNNWIEVTRSKGWIDERYAYWFGTTDWQQRVQ